MVTSNSRPNYKEVESDEEMCATAPISKTNWTTSQLDDESDDEDLYTPGKSTILKRYPVTGL